MGAIKEVLDFQVIELRLPKCIEEGLSWMEGMEKSSTKFGVSGSINNTVAGIRET